MAFDLIKYAFVAGEVSPTLFGRSDLEKYDLGLAIARNFFVDYRGGISSRPGTEFVDFVKDDDKPTKFVPFKFAPNLANTYIILFGHQYIRFIQDGAYVVEGDVTISGITKADPGVVTATGHSYSNGDWVYISAVVGMTEVNGRLFQVANKTSNTFELQDPFGVDFDTSALTAYTSGGTLNRVYTVTSTYTGAELAELSAYQRRDFVRLTHPDHPIRNLVRSGATSWALNDESFGSDIAAPANMAAVSSAGPSSGNASVGFIVTAVTANGEESLGTPMDIVVGAVDYTATAGSVRVTWDVVADAAYYNVYRTKVLSQAGQQITKSEQVGFIGKAYGPIFVDGNIIPDFTKSPPGHYNPFAHAGITGIVVTAGGASYDKADTVSVSGSPGTGFAGYPIVNDAGAIVDVVITNAGSGYVSPTVSFGTSTGSGATATATAGAASGNYPSTSNIFQQRQVYAASDNNPLTLWASKPGYFSNFDVSAIVAANDSYEFEIDSEEVAPIAHLVATRGGELILTQTGVWILRGAEADSIVTPTNALADPQSYRGCSAVPPIPVDTDLLYIEGKSPTVRLLSYNDTYKVFGGQDMSILANHMFSDENQIVSWAYAQNPFNLIYAVRADGALLAFTLVKEQDVYAWTRCFTKGLFLDVAVVQENQVDVTYLMVKRYVNGRWTKFIERFASRRFEVIEDAWCVDSGLRNTQTFPAATLTPGAASGSGVTFTASASVFTDPDDVGSVIRVGGGKATITSVTSGTEVIADIIRDITAVIPEDSANTPLEAESGDWTLDTPITSVGGLWHLEGETVRILADGNVLPDKIVTDGAVALGVEATKIVVGLGYDCRAQTLPPTAGEEIIEGRRKNIIGSAVRVNDTRGLKVGANLNSLYDIKERSTELYGEPIELQDGFQHILVEAPWDDNGQTLYVQQHPLPATILGLVTTLEVGDDRR